MTYSYFAFSSLQFTYEIPPVTITSGMTNPAVGVVTMLLLPTLFLYPVFYVPSFAFNLLSVTSLLRNNNVHIFFNTSFVAFQDMTTQAMTGRGH